MTSDQRDRDQRIEDLLLVYDRESLSDLEQHLDLEVRLRRIRAEASAKDGTASQSSTPLRVVAREATADGSKTRGNLALVEATEVESGGRRIVGAERATLARNLVQRYSQGESIRKLASDTGRSYGFVHRVLTESGVQLRQRGGARRRKQA